MIIASVGLCSCSILNSVMTESQWKAAFSPSRFTDFTMEGKLVASGEEIASFALLAEGSAASWDVAYAESEFSVSLRVEEGGLFASEEAFVDLRPLLSLFVDSFSDYGYYFGSYQSKLGQSAAEAACSAVNSLGGIVEFATLPSSAESEVLFDGALRVSRIDLDFAGGGAVSRPSGSDASSGLKMSLSFSAYGSTSSKKQGA